MCVRVQLNTYHLGLVVGIFVVRRVSGVQRKRLFFRRVDLDGERRGDGQDFQEERDLPV